MLACLLPLLLSAAPPPAIPVRYPLGTLHGFPSLSDTSGKVIADGEFTQQLHGDRLVVVARWRFADGRRAEERDEFTVGRALEQERFSWVETRDGEEQRRFEVDFRTGRSSSAVRDERRELKRDEAELELPRGRSFAGYGTALAVTQLSLGPGEVAEITFVAFTPKPKAIGLEIKPRGEERVPVAGRAIRCNKYALHPKIPFPLDLLAGAKDAHLWLTHAGPPALVRAEQNLVTKDDPIVLVDINPRGAAAPPSQARRVPARP